MNMIMLEILNMTWWLPFVTSLRVIKQIEIQKFKMIFNLFKKVFNEDFIGINRAT